MVVEYILAKRRNRTAAATAEAAATAAADTTPGRPEARGHHESRQRLNLAQPGQTQLERNRRHPLAERLERLPGE